MNVRQNKQIKVASLFLAPVIAVGIIGCNSESIDSEDVRTSGIWAMMKVEARDDGRSRVVVELNAGGELGTNVELTDSEYLEVEAAGIVKQMNKDDDLFDIDYQVYMDTVESDTLFRVSFYRSSGENIVNSTVRLPASFSITSPLDEAQFGLDENVSLVWTPERSDQNIQLDSFISCTTSDGNTTSTSQSISIADTGNYNYDISSNAEFGNGTVGLDVNAGCELTLTLVRQSSGAIDPAFDEGGSFKAYQTRKVSNLDIRLN